MAKFEVDGPDRPWAPPPPPAGAIGPLSDRRSSSEQSGSSSSDYAYDYSGQELARKFADEASQLNASKAAALYGGDIQGALATGRRIADLSAYVNAYAGSGGRGGFFPGVGEVMPGRRVAREGHNSSGEIAGTQTISFHDPNKREQQA